MVKNNIEVDVKVKCVEEHMTQADIAKKFRYRNLILTS